jgi:hypothetical protein
MKELGLSPALISAVGYTSDSMQRQWRRLTASDFSPYSQVEINAPLNSGEKI